jgi:glycosyltransferase involved in cell wall biosynthesis
MVFPGSAAVHLWVPDLFTVKGGIQTYSYFFLQALSRLIFPARVEVFSKNDAQMRSRHPNQTNLSFHSTGGWSLPVRTAIFSLQLASLGILQRPKLIITTHVNFAIVAYWLKRLTKTPYWVVAHGIEVWNLQQPQLQLALSQADRILVVSHYTRDRLLKEQKLDPDQVLLLPNTFNSDQFHIADKPNYLLSRYGLTVDQPIILTVARLDRTEIYKGYDQVIKAMPLIQQQIPNAHYVLVGKGDDRPRLEQLITQLGLQDCVTLTGFVSDAELCDHYNLCNVFVMPSQKEGFGIVYLEAMACGKPAVGGNQDGALDALGQGELGVLVNSEDEVAIAQTLSQILQGSYPHSLIYQPEQLRSAVLDRFGFAHFQAQLSKHLENFWAANP